MINSAKIQCFLTLAQTLNFTETANRLFMTQQGVSKQIAQIEDDFGFPLFYRTKSNRKVSLTNAGEECYALFSKFVKDYSDFKSKYQDAFGTTANIVRVGYQDWLNVTSPIMNAWNKSAKRFTSLNYMIERHSPGNLNQLFASGDLDMIVTQERFIRLNKKDKYLVVDSTPLELLVSEKNHLYSDDATYLTFSSDPEIIDSFDYESFSDTKERARKENKLYGLYPKTIKIMPNRDSCYAEAELGHGFVVATAMSQNTTLQRFPLGINENLICVWRLNDKQEALEFFALTLKKEFQNSDNA